MNWVLENLSKVNPIDPTLDLLWLRVDLPPFK